MKLTRGKFTRLDPSEYAVVSKCKWSALKNAAGNWYAQRTIVVEGRRVGQLLHRLIMNAPKGMEVDHINGDGLDNRRKNLRLCTRAQNACNHRPVKSNTSGVSGVYWRNDVRAWQIHITKDGVRHYLGYRKQLSDARRVRNKAARKYFGEFARISIAPQTMQKRSIDVSASNHSGKLGA